MNSSIQDEFNQLMNEIENNLQNNSQNINKSTIKQLAYTSLFDSAPEIDLTQKIIHDDAMFDTVMNALTSPAKSKQSQQNLKQTLDYLTSKAKIQSQVPEIVINTDQQDLSLFLQELDECIDNKMNITNSKVINTFNVDNSVNLPRLPEKQIIEITLEHNSSIESQNYDQVFEQEEISKNCNEADSLDSVQYNNEENCKQQPIELSENTENENITNQLDVEDLQPSLQLYNSEFPEEHDEIQDILIKYGNPQTSIQRKEQNTSIPKIQFNYVDSSSSEEQLVETNNDQAKLIPQQNYIADLDEFIPSSIRYSMLRRYFVLIIERFNQMQLFNYNADKYAYELQIQHMKDKVRQIFSFNSFLQQQLNSSKIIVNNNKFKKVILFQFKLKQYQQKLLTKHVFSSLREYYENNIHTQSAINAITFPEYDGLLLCDAFNCIFNKHVSFHYNSKILRQKQLKNILAILTSSQRQKQFDYKLQNTVLQSLILKYRCVNGLQIQMGKISRRYAFYALAENFNKRQLLIHQFNFIRGRSLQRIQQHAFKSFKLTLLLMRYQQQSSTKWLERILHLLFQATNTYINSNTRYYRTLQKIALIYIQKRFQKINIQKMEAEIFQNGSLLKQTFLSLKRTQKLLKINSENVKIMILTAKKKSIFNQMTQKCVQMEGKWNLIVDQTNINAVTGAFQNVIQQYFNLHSKCRTQQLNITLNTFKILTDKFDKLAQGQFDTRSLYLKEIKQKHLLMIKATRIEAASDHICTQYQQKVIMHRLITRMQQLQNICNTHILDNLNCRKHTILNALKMAQVQNKRNYRIQKYMFMLMMQQYSLITQIENNHNQYLKTNILSIFQNKLNSLQQYQNIALKHNQTTKATILKLFLQTSAKQKQNMKRAVKFSNLSLKIISFYKLLKKFRKSQKYTKHQLLLKQQNVLHRMITLNRIIFKLNSMVEEYILDKQWESKRRIIISWKLLSKRLGKDTLVKRKILLSWKKVMLYKAVLGDKFEQIVEDRLK
ncbi:Hypothetical_protein [Hexamita inflata]|uniref:Hypothetical_protein n=1 Tax=Hexamita inflata TaxID=28002 RepID=A0AA86QNX0_9EUKA|nr:Hypothetical protein HINF_LOCUS50781 [Hexamita inflata]